MIFEISLIDFDNFIDLNSDIMTGIENRLLGLLKTILIMIWPYFTIWTDISTKTQLFANHCGWSC